MSSNNLQQTNAGFVDNSENGQPVSLEVANPLSDIIASPPELQDQTNGTTKIKTLGYGQQSAAINHAQADGQIVERHVLHKAIRQLYEDAQTEGKIKKISGDNYSIDGANASSLERCMDLFCQACTYSFQNPFGCSIVQSGNGGGNEEGNAEGNTEGNAEGNEKETEKKNILNTLILCRGRAKGLNLLKQLVFPLVGPGWRIVWIVFELLFVLLTAALPIGSYVTGSQEVFNLVHLVLVSIFIGLVLIDVCYSIPMNVQICRKRVRGKKAKKKEKRREIVQGELIEEQEENQPQENTTSEDSTCSCKCCCKRFEKFSDLVRILLTEILATPLLICNIFNSVISFPTYSDNFLLPGLILSVCSVIGILIYVYTVRIAILSGTMRYIRKASSEFFTDRQEVSTKFKVLFVLHNIGQMIVQMIMLAAVGIIVYVQNAHFYNQSNRDMTINVSSELWYMLIATTVLPIFGFFTFFLVNSYWVQQFPIAFCINLIKALRLPEAEKLFDLKSISKEGAEKVIETIKQFVVFDKLENEYKNLCKKSISTKCGYPFRSPVTILLCTLYLAAQLGFVSCVILGLITGNSSSSGFIQLMFYFFAFVGGLAFFINIHAFLIPLLWIVGIIFVYPIGLFVWSISKIINLMEGYTKN